MILHDRKLILNNGKSCCMRSGEAEDSRKLALYFRQVAQEEEPQELLAGEVPDVYQTRRILQQFAEEERRILLLAWMRRQIVGFGVLYPASRERPARAPADRYRDDARAAARALRGEMGI